jgi:hypothetical protein
MKIPEVPHWLIATDNDFALLATKATRFLVPHVSTMRVIGNSWKYKLKRNSSCTFVKYKARVVARGDMQYLDYACFLAHVDRYTTPHVLFALT